MMKVSDPIMFGHAVEVYFEDAFAKHGAELKAAGANPNNGLAAVYSTIESMPSPKREEVQTAFATAAAARPSLAYVDSHKGITNLHVPSGACHRALDPLLRPPCPATPSLPSDPLLRPPCPATPSLLPLPCYLLAHPAVGASTFRAPQTLSSTRRCRMSSVTPARCGTRTTPSRT